MRIFARKDENNVVINLFSDVRETPKEDDILIEEGSEPYHAHVHLKYKLMTLYNDLPYYKYKIVDGKLTERTEEDFKREESESLETVTIETRISDLEEAIAQLVFGGASDYANI